MTRLSADRLQEIYAGTLDLVVAKSYDGVTVDALAEATRISKATLYRQWGGKLGLVVAAATTVTSPLESLGDTGSLRGDLRELAELETAKLAEFGLLIAALVQAAESHPEVKEALQCRIITDRKFVFGTLTDRAIARGEVPADHPGLRYAFMLFIAGIALHSLVDDAVVDTAHLHDLIDHVILPVLLAPARP